MRWTLILLWAALAVAPCETRAAAAPSGMVPGGSYLDSCREIVFNAAANLLYATCTHRTPDGLFSAKGEDVRSSEGFDVTPCAENSVFNDDGNLYCLTKTPWGRNHAIPEGSYRASCTRSRVVNNVLIAECDDSSDATRPSEINLDRCRWGGDIFNAEGLLRCEQLVGSAELAVPPISLVSGAPAVVKPAMIAPLAPIPSADSTVPEIAPLAPAASADPTAPEPKKRERKKRNRGERG